MRRHRIVPVAVVAVLTAAALAGCTASTASGSSGSAVQFQSRSGRAPAAASAAGETSAASGKTAAVDRSIVTTGSLRLVTDHPVRVAQRIEDLVTGVQGRVARSTEDPEGRASASLELRIPAADFSRTLAAIERQGDERNVSIESSDVTAKVTDYGVRIANLRTSIARLQQLLKTATSSSALVEIEGALTDRQGTLEQLLGEQRTLADQVTYATLSVSVVSPAAVPERGPNDFVTGLLAGAHSLASTVAALAVAAGVLLPWVVVLGALGGGAALVVRAIRRRARPTSA